MVHRCAIRPAHEGKERDKQRQQANERRAWYRRHDGSSFRVTRFRQCAVIDSRGVLAEWRYGGNLDARRDTKPVSRQRSRVRSPQAALEMDVALAQSDRALPNTGPEVSARAG